MDSLPPFCPNHCLMHGICYLLESFLSAHWLYGLSIVQKRKTDLLKDIHYLLDYLLKALIYYHSTQVPLAYISMITNRRDLLDKVQFHFYIAIFYIVLFLSLIYAAQHWRVTTIFCIILLLSFFCFMQIFIHFFDSVLANNKLDNPDKNKNKYKNSKIH